MSFIPSTQNNGTFFKNPSIEKAIDANDMQTMYIWHDTDNGIIRSHGASRAGNTSLFIDGKHQSTETVPILSFYQNEAYADKTLVPLLPGQSMVISWYEKRDPFSKDDLFVDLLPVKAENGGIEYIPSLNFEQEYGGYAYPVGTQSDDEWQLYQYVFKMPNDSPANGVLIDSLQVILRVGATRYLDDFCVNYGTQRTMPDGIGYPTNNDLRATLSVHQLAEDGNDVGYDDNYEGITATSLFNNMSSFYPDYTSDDAFIKTWFGVLVKVFNFLDLVGDQIRSNNYIDQTELFRTIPFQGSWFKNSLYDIITLRKAYPDWDTKGIAEKMSILESLGLYETLDAKRSWDKVIRTVGNLTIDKKVAQTAPYQTLGDYLIRDNKLFLLSGIAQPVGIESKIGKQATLKNVEIDLNTLYDRWGKLLKFQPPQDVTKEEYRAILVSLLRAFMQGPKMDVLQEVVENITGWSDVNVYDLYSPNNPKKWIWDKWYLTPFDFLIRIPDYLSVDWTKTRAIWDMMQIIKESHTNLRLLYEKKITDEAYFDDRVITKLTRFFSDGSSIAGNDHKRRDDFYLKKKIQLLDSSPANIGLSYDVPQPYDSGYLYDTTGLSDSIHFFTRTLDLTDPFGMLDVLVLSYKDATTEKKSIYLTGDKITSGDSSYRKKKVQLTENIAFDSFFGYDVGLSYDSNLKYDPSNADNVTFEVKTFPEIPRSFTATKSGTTVTATMRDNDDGTTKFELWKSVNGGAFTLVGNQNSTMNKATTITFTDSGLAAGSTVSYKARAFGDNRYSEYTLTTTLSI